MIKNITKILNIANTRTTSRKFPQIDQIVSYTYESPQKVIIAALSLKINDPTCDTRYHQKSHGGKYCLRSIETQTTLWAAREGYFSTHCPGTLSNALRHKEPFDIYYSRVWKSEKCKSAFLQIFENMNKTPIDCMDMLIYMLSLLRKNNTMHQMIASTNVDAEGIDLYTLLCNLCNQTYNKSSIIPVFIVYAYYQAINTVGLLSLKAHNSPDIKNKSYGDIEIHKNGVPSIIIEIKHNLEIKDEHLLCIARKTYLHKTKNYIFTSLVYQPYIYNDKYNIVIWNVASFVHYNLYNTNLQTHYINILYKLFMTAHIDLHTKDKIKKCFQI